MNRSRFSPVLFLLLLLMFCLVVSNVTANTILDPAERTWRSSSIEFNGSKQVRIVITDAAGPLNSFYATDWTGDNIDPFLYVFEDQVWMVWSRERSSIPGTYDISHRRLYVNGDLGNREPVTKISIPVDYSDHKPTGAACPAGHHIAFQRETTTESGVHRQIVYMNNIYDDGSTDGTWGNAVPEVRELLAGRSGTDAILLLGNNNNGSPTVLVFKEWVTQYHISGLKSRKSQISIYERILDTHGPADPNPWEKITVHLPDNPLSD